jgi:hypothetical protein
MNKKVKIGKYTVGTRTVIHGNRNYGIVDVFLKPDDQFTEHDFIILINYCCREGFFDGCHQTECHVYDETGERLKFNVYSEKYE